MRIAVVHSFYNSDVPSGENVVVGAQVDALRAAGHDVELVAQYSDERRQQRSWPVEAALTTLTGIGPDPTRALAELRPDLVHVHNLFPNFGTRWLASWPGPLVATVHNFRPLCAAGTLMRDGRRCTDCADGDPFAGVRHRCFRGSAAATLPLAVAHRHGPAADPLLSRADRLVAISQRAMREYTGRRVPQARFAVVPNFVAEHPAKGLADALAKALSPAGPATERWLFVGRLSREKGVAELLRAWPPGRRLDLIGDGESAAEFRALTVPGVRFLGALDNTEIRRKLLRYTGLVVPSQWPEAGPPLTYMEALAAGTPVIAFAGNGAADDVTANRTGAVVATVPTVAELAAALDEVGAARGRLSVACRAAYEAHFTAAAWVERMTAVYRDLLPVSRVEVT